MINTICLDQKYSTTRLIVEDKSNSTLLTQESTYKQKEGGLRTKGYFKNSYHKKQLITIITVVFNAEKYLEETILSVINQTYNNVEYIIIDGGSTDNSLDIIKKYENKVDYWISENDDGIYDAMNKGIKKASGDFINLLNAGDRLYDENVLEKIVENSGSNPKLIYGDTVFYNEATKNEKYQYSLEFTTKNILKYTTRVVCHQSMFFNKTDMPLFSMRYKIKDELKQYFDLARIDKDYKKIRTPVSIFLEGGLGTQEYKKNTKERIKVVFDEYRFYGLLVAFPKIFLFIINNFFIRKM